MIFVWSLRVIKFNFSFFTCGLRSVISVSRCMWHNYRVRWWSVLYFCCRRLNDVAYAVRLCEFFNLVLAKQWNSIVYFAVEGDHRANTFKYLGWRWLCAWRTQYTIFSPGLWCSKIMSSENGKTQYQVSCSVRWSPKITECIVTINMFI